MSPMSAATLRMYTWVDIDTFFVDLARRGGWPSWLLECDAYWDSVRLNVTNDVTDETVSEWLDQNLGVGSVRSAESGLVLVLEDVPGAPSARILPLQIIRDEPVVARRDIRWRERRITADLARPFPEPEAEFAGGVNIIAFHSFKGGVGRTIHAVALAHAAADRGHRVLLVDADLEAPGITWMLSESGKRLDYAYEDFLALLHESQDGQPREAVRLGAAYLSNQTISGVTLLPARRSPERVIPPSIEPADLLTADRPAYYLTDSIAALASSIRADTVIVDLRAGGSELSASVLMDPRVKRIFVTTISSQSLDGCEAIARELGRRSVVRSFDPSPTLIVTQFRNADSAQRLAELAGPILDALSGMILNPDAGQDAEDTAEVDAAVLLKPIFSAFQEDLLAFPGGWNEVGDLVRRSKLVDLLAGLADEITQSLGEELDETPALPDDGVADLRRRRELLRDFASGLVFAETTMTQSFLATDSLRNLVEAHRSEVPLCVVTGAKGAGKTFTQLQMCYKATWKGYAQAVRVNDVVLDVPLVPVLTSRNVSQEIADHVEEMKRVSIGAAQGVPISFLDVRTMIQDGISNSLSEREWRQLWLTFLVRSMGVDVEPAESEKRMAQLAATERRIFLIDGLEDILQDIATDGQQQRALRVLLTDCLEWLQSLRGRPFGLIVFVRIDLVRAAILQNSNQLLARYRDYSLRWNPSEAVRLALWVSQESGALPGVSEDDVITAPDSELTEKMHPVWGEKMGSERSREARSRGWFLAALSDFNSNIQARDIVKFLEESAKGSVDDNRWADRLLAPIAMREALVTCSRQKIEAISEETPMIGEVLTKLRNLSYEKRQVPFEQQDVSLEPVEVELLVGNGVIFREEDRYWIPEIYRHGLGFRASGRPRVLAVANLVRKRNNQEYED